MGKKEYDFKKAYSNVTPEILGCLRVWDVDILICLTKMHMVKNFKEMLIFFEALKNAMETYYPEYRSRYGKKIDFFGKFDYKIQVSVPSMELDGKLYDHKITFVFYSIIGYGISTTIYFDFDGRFFVLGNNVEKGWTDQ